MSGHTPGPWQNVPGRGDVKGPMGVQIAFCGASATFGPDGSYSISLDESLANACLSAAAPDLLTALLTALVALQRGEQISYEEYVLATDAIEAAIAKAEGRA